MGEHHGAPQIPDVTDEAGESPTWLPMLGLGLLLAFVAWVVVSHQGGTEQPGEEPAAEVAE